MLSKASDKNAFSINGLEFDLDEFDCYEQRLKAKRLLQPKMKECSNDETDDLDEYLNKLVIDEMKSKPNELPTNKTISSSIVCTSEPPSSLNETEQSSSAPTIYRTPTSVPFPVLMYWMVGLLVFVNSVTKPLPVPECKQTPTNVTSLIIPNPYLVDFSVG